MLHKHKRHDTKLFLIQILVEMLFRNLNISENESFILYFSANGRSMKNIEIIKTIINFTAKVYFLKIIEH